MYANDNPETKTLVLGAGVLLFAGLGAAYFLGKSPRKGEEGAAAVADAKNKKDPVNLVKAHLVAKGKNPDQYKFRAQPKGDGKDVMVQAKSTKSGKTFKFGVRGTKVKLMSDDRDKSKDSSTSAPKSDSGGFVKKGDKSINLASELKTGPGTMGPSVVGFSGAYGVFQPG